MKSFIQNLIYKSSIKKIILILIFLSIILGAVSEFHVALFNLDKNISWNKFWSIPIIFFNIYPSIFIIRGKLKKNVGIIKYILAVFYFLIFIPLVQYILIFNGVNVSNFSSLKIVTLINVTLLFFSFYKLFQYNFIEIIIKRRKIKSNDLYYILLFYVVIGIVFGFLYYILSIWSGKDVLRGIDHSLGTLSVYFQYIYFSFVTLATVGYGDLIPASNLARFIVIIEIITGLILVNLILVLVVSSEISDKKESKKGN